MNEVICAMKRCLGPGQESFLLLNSNPQPHDSNARVLTIRPFDAQCVRVTETNMCVCYR